jgi:hypothetical protein
MDSFLESELQERGGARLTRQALWFFLHTILALAAWFGLMMAGYAVNPVGVPQWAILLASFMVPLVIGLIVARIHSDEMATSVWLLGLIWMMIVSLWILDMPTGPNHCFQCGATEKLTRTFLCIPQPSGLIDDDGPFIGTWPSVALLGYSIGARLGRRRG